ncbi:MAG: hypothetical protein ACKOAU_17850 [Pirellula sp.]
MNQRQAIPKHRSARQHPKAAGTTTSLPPVLFSLPDLSVLCQSPCAEPSSAEPSAQAAALPPTTAATSTVQRELPRNPIPHSHARAGDELKSSSLLNTAIGFLAFALLLIGLKLYTDRASQRNRFNEQLTSSSARGNATKLETPKTPGPESRTPANPGNQIPHTSNFNAGPQRATYQTPVLPPHNPHVQEQTDSGSKAVLEISDPALPVVPASYPTEPIETHAAPSPVNEPVAPNPLILPATPAMPPTPATSSTSIPPPAAAMAASIANSQTPISASSLNTRDMILLRQGKSIDLSNRDRDTMPVSMPTKSTGNSGVKLNGETYPPVRQKYEPISVPPTYPTVSRPTSMEVPTPPKPYQPIGIPKEVDL